MNVLKDFPEIKSVEELKIHEVGNIKFINIKVSLEDIMYSSSVEGIKNNIKNKISESIPDAEIILETKYLFSKSDIEKYIKEIVLSQSYVKDIHDISIYNVDSRTDVSIHVELGKYIKLDEAEKLTKIIEEKIKEKIKNIRSVYIHIEDVRSSESWNDITKKSEQFIADIKKEVSLYIDPETCHNFTVFEREGQQNIAFHCRLQKNLDIKQAHSIITQLENDIKRKFENISEVVIHVEPY
jgi:divalent metal cation (Fe/Co/Zn/Cd) transporter